jgi:signal transduction histidine kinase
VSALSLALDITERRRAEEAAQAAQQRLLEQQRGETERVQAELDKARERLVNQTRLATIGQLAGSIAHELRNPLGAARNAAYFLKRYADLPDPELREYLGIVEDEISAADRIITDLMNMTRARPPTTEDVNLGDLIRQVLDRSGPGDGPRCRLKLAPDPFIIRADPSQMRQVITNLVINAGQAMGEEGEIEIEAGRTEAYDVLSIRDNGQGVPPEHRDRIFEALFTTRAKGTGLGLTICREIIGRHGGTIELVSDGRPGAAFRIRLPRRAAHPGPTEPRVATGT